MNQQEAPAFPLKGMTFVAHALRKKKNVLLPEEH